MSMYILNISVIKFANVNKICIMQMGKQVFMIRKKKEIENHSSASI